MTRFFSITFTKYYCYGIEPGPSETSLTLSEELVLTETELILTETVRTNSSLRISFFFCTIPKSGRYEPVFLY